MHLCIWVGTAIAYDDQPIIQIACMANGRQHDAAGVDTGEHQRVDAVGAPASLAKSASKPRPRRPSPLEVIRRSVACTITFLTRIRLSSRSSSNLTGPLKPNGSRSSRKPLASPRRSSPTSSSKPCSGSFDNIPLTLLYRQLLYASGAIRPVAAHSVSPSPMPSAPRIRLLPKSVPS
jgi:hypothetical protein